MVSVAVEPHILIVEDHRDFRQAVRRLLELKNVKAQMVEAASGEEGVLIAQRVKPKVVIMDFLLRGMNGLEAAQQIKENHPACNIIMLTTFDHTQIPQAGRHDVVHAFISKGDLYDLLIPVIEEVL